MLCMLELKLWYRCDIIKTHIRVEPTLILQYSFPVSINENILRIKLFTYGHELIVVFVHCAKILGGFLYKIKMI